MTNLKKLMITGIVLIIIGTLGSFLTFRDNGIDIAEEKVFKERNITAVELESNNAAVEIIPTTDPETKVEVVGKGTKDTMTNLTAKVDGETLIVNLEEKQIGFIHLDFGSLTLRIALPEKQYKSMIINNDNGKINIANLGVEQLKAESNNGRIEMKNILSKKVEVNSDNGRVSLEHVIGSIKGKTNNGKFSILTAALDQPIELETNNGSIEIETENEPTNVTFDVHVDNGSINILDKYKGSTVIGNGENLVKLTTNNGKIHVLK
ncbi:DUF4097 family beta strand repeat-containing protein [Niallia sp.]|uniref:DUF4097 family beta strand repeat-containing protein n=1 Tax=Niallia sp. TaxID=2837523 RepID=UPI0028A0573F|nr:DUF4097 family beta strand repeat-containing protein [Niallia sp.]